MVYIYYIYKIRHTIVVFITERSIIDKLLDKDLFFQFLQQMNQFVFLHFGSIGGNTGR